MIITIYTTGSAGSVEDLRQAAQVLERIAKSLRLGHTADPHQELTFFVEDDPLEEETEDEDLQD